MKLRQLTCCLILQSTLLASLQPCSAQLEVPSAPAQAQLDAAHTAQVQAQLTAAQSAPAQTQLAAAQTAPDQSAPAQTQSAPAQTQAPAQAPSKHTHQAPHTLPQKLHKHQMPPRLTPMKQIRQSQLGKSQLVDRPRRELFRTLQLSDLPEDTKELSDQLEITDQLKTLYDSNQLMTNEQRFLVREKVIETILEAYLDAASVQAEADREQGRLEAVRDKLTDKRDHAVNLNNAANFTGSGTLNTIGSVLGFDKAAPPFPGNFFQMLSGVVAMGMSTYSLKQQRGGKIPGIGAPTMLAELFGRPIDESTTYPESVWRFFHGNSPDAPGLTRAQFLEKEWIERGHLDPPGNKRAALKLDLVCGVITKGAAMTIDDLSDEITMLEDVSTIAELMGHHLRDLLRMVDSDLVLNND